ncbi:hypothetical protein J3S90_08765 [Flavobacterium sp. P4023]|uniref:Uncharacterized protein n=1 Tax=Flavobacterium flabelliforme TaxID=2816119 RepID=A0ABS5CTF4_9FLAO|nr:hypothetical protein [Flavobacterium flabelliforme]MBP4141893.1 hypothetical protein [Flavobacterium flabelliforme]
MNDIENKLNLDKQKNRDNKVPDSLLYPPSEDIYKQLKKESDIDPENISKNKVPVEIGNTGDFNEKDFNQDNSGADLDVPGAELDDQAEQIGSEDEENNYYSLGGDDHNDLDENTPDTI